CVRWATADFDFW
nr:immunoglobulin heavy chain junction region [Macaca mulatta]